VSNLFHRVVRVDCRSWGSLGQSEDDGYAANLELAGHDLDFVVLSVERGVVRDGDLAIGLGQDAGDTFITGW
jgi:hypothetical protein